MDGFKCYLGTKGAINLLAEQFNNYLYIDKGFHEGISECIHEKIRSRSGKIVSLDEEGAVDFPDNSTIMRRYPGKLFRDADIVFLWGNSQFNLLRRNFTGHAKVIVSGHPRFELLKREWRGFYKSDASRIKDKYGNFILINTNMGFGNNINGDQFVRNNYRGRFKKIDSIIELDKGKIGMIDAFVSKLISTTTKNIVIRPHPEEDTNFYEERFRDTTKVNVVREGSVIPWLISSDIMVHTDCTTAIESIFLGWKPFSLLPEYFPKDLITQIPIAVSDCYTSAKDLVNAMERNNFVAPKADPFDFSILESNFNASKSAIKIISKNIKKSYGMDIKNHINKVKIRGKLELLFFHMKDKLRGNLAPGLYDKKINGFNKENINLIHSRISQSEKDCDSIAVKNISHNCFLFQK